MVKHSLPLITCERGLGRMRAEVCGRRWQIAHGVVNLGNTSITAQAIRNSPCRACTYGEARVAPVDSPALPAAVQQPSAAAAAEHAAPEGFKRCACDGCQNVFPKDKNKRYCSPECSDEGWRRRRNRRRAEREGFVALVDQTRPCKKCQKDFKPTSGNEHFCGECKDYVPKDSRTRPRQKKAA